MILADRRLNNHDHYHEGGSSSSSALLVLKGQSRRVAVAGTKQELLGIEQSAATNETTTVRMSPLLDQKQSRSALKQSHRTIRLAMKKSTITRMQAISTSFNNNQTSYKKLYYSSKLAFLVLVATFMTILLLACNIETVSSLNCYTCSSADDPGCDESFSGRANFTKDTDCERQIGRQAKVCRKIVQYLEDKKIVIRSCGWIDEHDEKERKPMCYKRSGTFALMMESCICYEDNCNHSASLVPNQSVLLLLASLSMIFYCFVSVGNKHSPSNFVVGGH